jgi:hypothetical protein
MVNVWVSTTCSNKCFDIMEAHTASTFRMTELTPVDVETQTHERTIIWATTAVKPKTH